MAYKMKHTKGNFPFKDSPMKDSHNRWSRFKQGVSDFADKAESYVEKATYVPGFIGQAASTLDGMKDTQFIWCETNLERKKLFKTI